MCDMYRYIEILIFSFNFVIQYWILGVSIHMSGQFNNSDFIICLILYLKVNELLFMIFFDHFFAATTKHNIYLYLHFNYYFQHHDTVLYHDIFRSNTQYYFKVIYHTWLLHAYLIQCPLM